MQYIYSLLGAIPVAVFAIGGTLALDKSKKKETRMIGGGLAVLGIVGFLSMKYIVG